MKQAIPWIEPAPITTIPDFPPDYIEEIRRSAATPEEAIDWSEFRKLLEADLRSLPTDSVGTNHAVPAYSER